MRLALPAVSLACLILSSTCLTQPMNWVQVQTKAPSARIAHGMAYDSFRGRTIVFGGSSGAGETWEFDGRAWIRMHPKTSPPGRDTSSMVFDAARGKTVLFGGFRSHNDTWTWDGKDWTKMNVSNSPPGRSNHGMVYDAGRKRVVLFGGRDTSRSPTRLFNDTWEWDGVNWTKVQTTRQPPGAHSYGMAYDSGRQRTVLFGGETTRGNQPVVFNETWEYDGKDWKKVAVNGPPSRCCFGMAYDPTRKRIVIFGGWPGGSLPRYLDDTWEYDGNLWTQARPTTSPAPRYDFDMMVYDQRHNCMVIFGGQTNGYKMLGDTWTYGSRFLTGTPPTISIVRGGTQRFSLEAGPAHASRLYWIFGSVTGTSPGVSLASPAGTVNIPLNPDFWTDITIGLANSALLTKTRGALDASGKGSATFNVPKITNQSAIGLKFYHAYLVYDAQSNFYMASNPVELTLVK